MPKRKRYIKKSADGRFFLCIENEREEIDLDKKTKLWTSSDYLFNESIRHNIQKTKKLLKQMLSWNEEKENFENCQKIKEFINKCTKT